MKKKVLTVLALVPLVLGTIGYKLSGEMITNALYAAFSLYFTSQISDAYNMYIEIFRIFKYSILKMRKKGMN